MSEKLRLAILASGGGTNLQAIIDRSRGGDLDAEIVLVLSNKPGSGALERARKAGLPVVCIDHREFSDRQAYDRALIATLQKSGAQLVVLAGYMRLLSEEVLQAFPNRIMNIHPALLPAFPGIRAQKQALEYGVRIAGCTVHFLDSGVDTGPIVLQAAVPVLEDDTEETLSRRILQEEHRIYSQAIQLYAEGRLQIEGRRVRIAPPFSGDADARRGE